MGMFSSVPSRAAIIPDEAPPLVPPAGGDAATKAAAVTPHLKDLKAVLEQAVSNIHGLAGVAPAELLAGDDGVLSLVDVSDLISDLLTVQRFS